MMIDEIPCGAPSFMKTGTVVAGVVGGDALAWCPPRGGQRQRGGTWRGRWDR